MPTRDARPEKSLSRSPSEHLQELQRRDRLAREHNRLQRHHAGSYARQVDTFIYRHGPDGAPYAVRGDVDFDVAPVPGDPEATLRKAMTVRRAALAPAQPTWEDFSTAARAAAIAARARADLIGSGRAAPVGNAAFLAAQAFDSAPGRERTGLIDTRA